MEGNINDHPFLATVGPDGRLSHWLRVDKELREAAGDTVTLEIAPVGQEPEPKVPDDLHEALAAFPEAKAVWDETTTIARLDRIH